MEGRRTRKNQLWFVRLIQNRIATCVKCLHYCSYVSVCRCGYKEVKMKPKYSSLEPSPRCWSQMKCFCSDVKTTNLQFRFLIPHMLSPRSPAWPVTLVASVVVASAVESSACFGLKTTLSSSTIGLVLLSSIRRLAVFSTTSSSFLIHDFHPWKVKTLFGFF